VGADFSTTAPTLSDYVLAVTFPPCASSVDDEPHDEPQYLAEARRLRSPVPTKMADTDVVTPAPVAEVRILGPVEAVANDGRVLSLGGPRQRALLALLALEPGRAVSADELAEELWAGEPPAGAAKTLRSYVSRLRSVVGAELVEARAGGYRIELQREQVDAHRFELLFRQGHEALVRAAAGIAAERLHAALALWRGAALADVARDGALAVEARRLDELRLVCLEQRIEADLALGRNVELIPELERLVHEEPMRERLWRQLVLAYYRTERQAEALRTYRRVRELLVLRLGIEPGDELKDLERAVLRQDVALVSRPEERHNLPHEATSFVGRERELKELQALLRIHRLITLTGIGGAGKTRLGLRAAAAQTQAFSGGVWLVDLTSLFDPALVARTAAVVVGAPDRHARTDLEALVAHLRKAETLLVLDNCEHLLAACAEIAMALLRGCPNVRILAMSRSPLSVAGEHEYAVDPLPVPAQTARRDELTGSPAVQLFLDRGRAVRRDVASADDHLPLVADICRELDGLPLAIELAAARAKALSLEEIADRISDRFRFLRAWKRVTDSRHQTLQATIDWSYDLLSEDERALLRQLSVFTGGFTLDAVAETCCGGDGDQATELVERLVDASLVVAEH
jgi:predicted ATPase/DNA-binding SARP family transcriptional activator